MIDPYNLVICDHWTHSGNFVKCIWEIIIWQFSYHTPYQPETPICARGPKARGLIWVDGWYGVWYENCHIVIYLSYIFFLTSLPIWYGMRSHTSVLLERRVLRIDRRVLRMCLTAECSECDDRFFFFAPAKKPFHPRDLVIWGFCSGKKKSRITHVAHYHTFCASQEWYVLESHVSITYAK